MLAKHFAALATFAAFFSVFSPKAALASRQISLTPLETDTIHGGVMNTACLTGNMLSGGSYMNVPGVQSMFHQYTFSFQNISSVNQTITLRILPSSSMRVTYSSGPGDGVTDTAGPSTSLSSNLDINFALLAGQATDQTITLEGSDAGAFIQAGGPTHGCNGGQRVCIAGVSTIYSQVIVNEDRGAVLASVHSFAHRCQGVMDLWQSAQVNMQLNGGRPF